MRSPLKNNEDLALRTTRRGDENFQNLFDLENLDSFGDRSDLSFATERKKVRRVHID